MKRRNVVYLGLLLFLPALGFDDEATKMEELMSAFAKHDMFSGTAIVARNGKIVFSGAYGHANKDFQVPNNLDTVGNIGSIGKTFTSVSIMQLMQQGKLALTDPLSKFLPDFPFPEKNTITVHHLLNHTSGLTNYMRHPDFHGKMTQMRKTSDVLPLIYDQKPAFEAGKDYQYSNSGMVLLGAIIEKVSGMSYADYLEKNIFEPLEMNRSGIIYREQTIANRSVGYSKADGSYVSNYFTEPPAFSDGGLYTSAPDMLKFDQALYGATLLTEETKKIMFTPNGPNNSYAYAWQLGEFAGHRFIGHGGGAPGINAMFNRYLDDKVTVIVIANYSGAANEVAHRLESILFNQPYEVPTKADSNYQVGFSLQMHERFREALPHFAKNISGDKPHLPSLYQAARTYIMGEFQVEKALPLLDSYIALAPPGAQPSKAAAWWRKGVVYEQLGKPKKALECHEKANAMEPEFAQAKESLERVKKGLQGS